MGVGDGRVSQWAVFAASHSAGLDSELAFPVGEQPMAGFGVSGSPGPGVSGHRSARGLPGGAEVEQPAQVESGDAGA